MQLQDILYIMPMLGIVHRGVKDKKNYPVGEIFAGIVISTILGIFACQHFAGTASPFFICLGLYVLGLAFIDISNIIKNSVPLVLKKYIKKKSEDIDKF